MDTKKQNDPVQPTIEPTNEATEGVKRLHLSVTQMKKLRSHMRGGGSGASPGRDW